jgi:hypothetical protein
MTGSALQNCHTLSYTRRGHAPAVRTARAAAAAHGCGGRRSWPPSASSPRWDERHMCAARHATVRMLDLGRARGVAAFRAVVRDSGGPLLGLDIGARHVGIATSDAGYVRPPLRRSQILPLDAAPHARHTLPRPPRSDGGNFFHLQQQSLRRGQLRAARQGAFAPDCREARPPPVQFAARAVARRAGGRR